MQHKTQRDGAGWRAIWKRRKRKDRSRLQEEVKVDAIESMTELYTSGIERLAEMQKKGLEIAVKHNAEVTKHLEEVHACRRRASLMLDLATTAFERFAETQKGAIDLMVEQTHTFAKLVKERKVKGYGHD